MQTLELSIETGTKIGSQIYFNYDTVRIIGKDGAIYDGNYIDDGRLTHLKIICKNKMLYEINHESIAPLRQVLIEKYKKVFYWEYITTEEFTGIISFMAVYTEKEKEW